MAVFFIPFAQSDFTMRMIRSLDANKLIFSAWSFKYSTGLSSSELERWRSLIELFLWIKPAVVAEGSSEMVGGAITAGSSMIFDEGESLMGGVIALGSTGEESVSTSDDFRVAIVKISIGLFSCMFELLLAGAGEETWATIDDSWIDWKEGVEVEVEVVEREECSNRNGTI